MKLKFFYRYGGPHLVLGHVYYASAETLPGQAGAERYDRYVCGVLTAIAQIPACCDRIIESIGAIERGLETSITEGGNDVLLNMDASGVQVDILVNDDWIGQPASNFSLVEWRIVIESWKRLLQRPKDSNEVDLVTL
ncbi:MULTISPECIES: hypothetical protein [unclassified Pseudomonas]|uniref:hypothetical protein n=1 Tax=unclassified Pseudomonas TaxID=196821 RepID=UPI000A1E1676|nr:MULTISPECIES: hypothetical protein [unclassified Pseudomonas]